MVYSVPPDSPVIHLLDLLLWMKPTHNKNNSNNNIYTKTYFLTLKSRHLFIFILKHIFSGSLHRTCSLRRFSPSPRDKRNVSRDAFFMPGVRKSGGRVSKKRSAPRCPGVLTGWSLQAAGGSPGKSWAVRLSRNTLFLSRRRRRKTCANVHRWGTDMQNITMELGKTQMKVARTSKFLFCKL